MTAGKVLHLANENTTIRTSETPWRNTPGAVRRKQWSNFHTAPGKLIYDIILKDAREGFSADPKPTPNHKAIFPKHCTPKPAQKPLAAPKSCHKPSKSFPKASQKAAQSLPKRVKTTRQILVANVVKTGAGSPLSKALGIRGNLRRRPGVANVSNGP